MTTTFILRGVSAWVYFQDRLELAKGAALDLIDDLMIKDSKDCPVAAAMTDGDRGSLLRVKKSIEAAEAGKKPVTSGPPYSP